MKKIFKTNKADIIFLCTTFFIGILIAASFFLTPGSDALVQVKVDGKELASFPLSIDTTYSIESSYGTNLLIIEDKSAYIKEATCPEGLCIQMGKISKVGQSIICLPNKVIVSIVSSDTSNTEYDSFTK